MQAIRSAAKRAPAALGSQKRTMYIEIASTHMAASLLTCTAWTFAWHMPKAIQEKWMPSTHVGVLPVYLAQQEKRSILQLSKQMDNTYTKWEKLPSEASLRASSTLL